jgi:uncharacterized protein (DUF2236 family)
MTVLQRNTSDWTILLVGGRSLLLQVAHPVVAAGVTQHSDFKRDPWKRLFGTLELVVGGGVFGWPDAPATAGARIRAMHRNISGVDADGSRYHALDPDAYSWVHATLIDGGLVHAKWFGRSMRGAQLDRYYEEMLELGRNLGLRDHQMQPDWASFRAYFDDMVHTRLERTGAVDDVLTTLAAPPQLPRLRVPEPLWRHGAAPVAGHLATLSTVGLLPSALRRRWGLPWTSTQQRELRAAAAIVRGVNPRLPARLRMHPWARHQPD